MDSMKRFSQMVEQSFSSGSSERATSLFNNSPFSNKNTKMLTAINNLSSRIKPENQNDQNSSDHMKELLSLLNWDARNLWMKEEARHTLLK
jgi:hypothetical protein